MKRYDYFPQTPHNNQVKDAISAVINVDDYGASARLLAATTLRNVLGTKNLGDILSDREAIANDMQVDIIRSRDSRHPTGCPSLLLTMR